ncbi:MAG: hypothetical protein HYX78_00865 [Armatimonadetes bacterium]|nr:hypothetical protein [Armatimonadota bacterium]
MGSFAYDRLGEFVVVQGYAWFWKGECNEYGKEEEEFFGSDFSLAYLAILNSPSFEAMLACFCPRVRGGQFDLSPRFVNRVFLPDLSDDLRVSSDTVQRLTQLGHRIHEGDMPAFEALDKIVAEVYGFSEADTE